MSSIKLDLIRPTSLNNSRILSWFSYKNPEYALAGSSIAGMNVGFNSSDTQEIILENLDNLVSHLGIDRKQLALAHQVHGTNVEVITSGGVFEETDGFVSNTPGVSLGIQVADCGAVLLGDFDNRVIGACHAGWRGAVGEIVPKTIHKMTELGANPTSIAAFVSPCIAVHNFEVGEEVAAQFPGELVHRSGYPKPHVDLSGLIRNQLIELGIAEENIESDGRCTIDHEQLFYSYRREKESSGRMIGIITLNNV